MEFIVKTFDELDKNELVEIYRLRISVFVVEQKCPYQEIDEYDYKCLHIYAKENNEMIAYCRILPAGCSFDTVAIGRVISIKRRQGIATSIVLKALEVAKDRFNADIIKVQAQVYTKSLYEKIGFIQTSDIYLEDDIPHVDMAYKK